LTRASRFDTGNASLDSIEPNGLAIASLLPDIGFLLNVLPTFFNTTTPTKNRTVPNLTCRTGNCTWELYSSLDVCSSCSNISQYVTKHNSTVFGNFGSLNATTYSITYGEGGINIMDVNGFINGRSNYNTLSVYSSSTFRPEQTISFTHWDSLLVSFAFLSGAKDWYQHSVPWENATILGTECALQLCAKVYDSKMIEGQFHQNIIPTTWRRVASSYQAFPLGNGSPSAPSLNGTLLDARFPSGAQLELFNDDTSSGGGANYFPRYDLQLEIINPPSQVQTIFNITQASIINLADFLTQNMTRQAISWSLRSSENFSATFEAAATAISFQMRDEDSIPILATSQEWEQYIHIRWPFLSFSVAIFLGSAVFVIRTIWETRKLKLKPLKGSSLSLLLHGLEADVSQSLRMERISDVHEVKVRAENVDGGLILRGGKNTIQRSSNKILLR
jgi:hypothetical protein